MQLHLPPHVTLVLPGSIPPDNLIRQLRTYAEAKAPTLFEWLKNSASSSLRLLPENIPCTSHEYFLLQELGFSAPESQAWASAWLGLEPSSSWIAYPCHLAIGQDISIHPLADIQLEEAQALLASIQPVLQEYQHSAHAKQSHAWNWQVPEAYVHSHCSLDALMQSHAWRAWTSDPSSAAWRRMLSDIQILWHNHPVNQTRESVGQLPVNMLWLMGPAAAWTPKSIQLHSQTSVYNHIPSLQNSKSDHTIYLDTTLRLHALNDDWGAWLEYWQTLEQTYLQPLEQAYQKKHLQSLRILLCDEERYGMIEPSATKIRWLRRLQKHLHSGRQPLWWSPL